MAAKKDFQVPLQDTMPKFKGCQKQDDWVFFVAGRRWKDEHPFRGKKENSALVGRRRQSHLISMNLLHACEEEKSGAEKKKEETSVISQV